MAAKQGAGASVDLKRGKDGFFTLCFKNKKQVPVSVYKDLFAVYYKSFIKINVCAPFLFVKFANKADAEGALYDSRVLGVIETELKPALEKDDRDELGNIRSHGSTQSINTSNSDEEDRVDPMEEWDKYLVVANYPTMGKQKLNQFMSAIDTEIYHQKKPIKVAGQEINLSYVKVKDTEKADTLMGYTEVRDSDDEDNAMGDVDGIHNSRIIMGRQTEFLQLGLEYMFERFNAEDEDRD